MFKDLLIRICEDTGYNPDQDRQAVINLVHRAAEMIYNRLECNNICREVTVLVPENCVISLPSFVGPLRGIKESQTEINFPVNTQMSPRFVKNDWQYKWKNWRELRTSAIHTNLSVTAPLTLTVAAVETEPVTVKIVGPTNTAQKIEEEVVMDATTKQTANSFGPDINTIASFSARNNDITIKDDNGNEVAKLYNNCDKSLYKLYDISEFYWNKENPDGTTTIEILYKHPYYKMLNDSDEFAAPDYEAAVYFMAMSLFYAPQEGKQDLSKMFYEQSLVEPEATKLSEEQKLVKKLDWGRHPLYNRIRRGYYNVPFVNPRAGGS